MPKATKRQKEKHADFTKAKLKLGKGKKQPSNATDTSFKARTIALPGQQSISRALTTATEPVTSGGLTLDEVILKLRHPNAGVRRDALGGIKEIVTATATTGTTAGSGHVGGRATGDVGKVLRALGSVISDDDQGVRKTLLNLLAWYIPLFPESILAPYLPLLSLQTSSGLSHIFPEIRLDACKLVHVLLDNVPSHVVGTWPASSSGSSAGVTQNTILEGLRLVLGLQGTSGPSTMGKTGSQGRLVALQTLLAFLRNALGDHDGSLDYARGGTAAGPSGAQHRVSVGRRDGGTKRSPSQKGKERMVDQPMFGMNEYGHLFEHDQNVGLEMGIQGSSDWEVARLGVDGLTGYEGASAGTVATLSTLYLQLAPLLLTTFLENAPTALAPNRSTSTPSDDVATSLCLVSCGLTVIFSKAILSPPSTGNPQTDQVRQNVSDFLKRMRPYFPFPTSNIRQTASGLSPGFEMSLAFATLTIKLSPTALNQEIVLPRHFGAQGWKGRVKVIQNTLAAARQAGEKRKSKGAKGDVVDESALVEVAEWIADLLTPNKDMLASPLTPHIYGSVLPLIRALMLLPSFSPAKGEDLDIPDISTYMGEIFLSHLLRTGSSSATRALGDELVIDLINLHEDPGSTVPFYLAQDSPLRALLRSWLETLPRVLWEVGSKGDGFAGSGARISKILEFLLRVGLRGEKWFAQAAPHSLISPELFPEIGSKLSTFFYIQHPVKGHFAGPWARLTDNKLQKLALDTASVWVEWGGDGLKEAVERVVQSSSRQAAQQGGDRA